MAIIGISGKSKSGKDTVGKIIQYLILYQLCKDDYNELNDVTFVKHMFNNEHRDLKVHSNNFNWNIVKFADALKDIVCLLINCTREQLENQEFKSRELGEKWRVYRNLKSGKIGIEQIKSDEIAATYILTPRALLQLLGTECGRNIIHPDIWINSLFSSYIDTSEKRVCAETGMPILATWEVKYPNWIITDLRFENELQAIKDRKGITIRVEKPIHPYEQSFNLIYNKQHESETALDNEKFDYIIDNNSNIETLIEKVKEILIKEKVI